jgi:hypothetical protein
MFVLLLSSEGNDTATIFNVILLPILASTITDDRQPHLYNVFRLEGRRTLDLLSVRGFDSRQYFDQEKHTYLV